MPTSAIDRAGRVLSPAARKRARTAAPSLDRAFLDRQRPFAVLDPA